MQPHVLGCGVQGNRNLSIHRRVMYINDNPGVRTWVLVVCYIPMNFVL